MNRTKEGDSIKMTLWSCILILASPMFALASRPFSHPNPPALPRVHPHPRLFFNIATLQHIEARYDDPWYADAQNQVAEGKDRDPIHAALYYLATGNASYIGKAITLARDFGLSYSGARQVDEKWEHERYYGKRIPHCCLDPIALVYDWLNDKLSENQESEMVKLLKERIKRYKYGIRNYNKWHESFHDRGPAYLCAGLAIWEHLSENEKSDLRNFWENTKGTIREMCPQSGVTNGYPYYQPYYSMTLLLWDSATDWNVETDPVRDYLTGEIKYFIHRMNTDATKWYQTYSDSRTNPDFSDHSYFLEPFQAYAVACRLDWGVGQWVANKMKRAFGFGIQSRSPVWVALLSSDKNIPDKNPATELSLAELYRQDGGPGNVTMRSGWNFENDISIGFFCQCYYEHNSNHFGHFDIRRGNTMLVARSTARTGGNHGFWNAHMMNSSFTHNCMAFCPPGEEEIEHAWHDNDTPDKLDSDQHCYYPAAEPSDWMVSYRRWKTGYKAPAWKGRISYYRNTDAYTIVSSECDVYYTRVKWYKRDLIYLRPDVLIIYDRFEPKIDLETVRFIVNLKESDLTPPAINRGWNPIQKREGWPDAGVFEADGTNTFSCTNEDSSADITLLHPQTCTLRTTGGLVGPVGKPSSYYYVAWVNNRSYWETVPGYSEPSSDFRGNGIDVVGCLQGVYRTEEIVTPSDANGAILNAVHVRGASDNRKPSYSLSSDVVKYSLIVTMPDGSKTYTLHLYRNRTGNPKVLPQVKCIGVSSATVR